MSKSMSTATTFADPRLARLDGFRSRSTMSASAPM
jgi:hypothetical protein